MGVLVVHGGAGLWKSPSRRAKRELLAALDVGVAALRRGSALEAVEEAVAYMEDSGVFNAGVGSALNLEGVEELDASIMDGSTLRAGAVGCVRTVRNPVRLARLVMEHTDHVLLVGEGAELLASVFKLSKLPPPSRSRRAEYRRRLSELLEKPPFFMERNIALVREHGGAFLYGTVGAVALDDDGNLAAATSTGGLWLKLPGRVGDSALIGCGTYADNRGGACSATGVGEAAIRVCLAKRVVDLMLRGFSPRRACCTALKEMLELVNLPNAVIAVDRRGNLAAAHTTPHLLWSYWRRGGQPRARIRGVQVC